MTKFGRNIRNLFCVLLAVVLCVSCAQNDDELELVTGKLHLKIGTVSDKTSTRATPAALGKPLVSKFKIKAQRTSSGKVDYDGPFAETIEVRCSDYDITAYCGENVILGKDAPYYEGTAHVTVEKDKHNSVTIPCRVANALLSVRFGRDEEEKKRFDRHYSDYGIFVYVDNYSMPITCYQPESSIYFRAGSSPRIVFYGTLNMDGNRAVSVELSSDQFPRTFDAAEHAIVTLTLPDPESSLNVNISKVEVEDVSMDETIPLSWLPVPTATPVHQYASNGDLVGTNVTFSNSYPGMNWKAVVQNSNGEEVRTVEGQGELQSKFSSSDQWPYLPQGNYTAHYYFVMDGVTKKVSSREFTVGRPQINVSVGGYSSYTKYLEGDIDAANKCDNKTIYEPYVMLHVSSELLSKYSYSFSYTYNGTKADIYNGQNFYYTSSIENQPIRVEPYILKANATFDGVNVEVSKNFYITGLPVKFTPPSESNGWKADTECVTFGDSEVKLGNKGGLNTHYNEKMSNANFAVPRGVVVAMNYNIMIHPATMGTTLSFMLGDNSLLVLRQEGGAANSTDYPFNGTATTKIETLATQMDCLNSYGGGSTCSYIYSLDLKYAQ